MKNEMWVIYPTDPTKGFCPSYCKTEESAWKEKFAAELLTGIKWTNPERTK